MKLYKGVRISKFCNNQILVVTVIKFNVNHFRRGLFEEKQLLWHN